MSFVQVFFNIPKGASTAQFAINEYQTVTQAFGQMPHLNNADIALFSNPPDLITFTKELSQLIGSLDEVATFVALIRDIDVSLGLAVIKGVFGLPWRILNTIASAFGNIVDLSASDSPRWTTH